jgi:hypothetical protein
MLSAEESADAAADFIARQRLAVLVPCYNEDTAIAKAVTDFRATLPNAALRATRGRRS